MEYTVSHAVRFRSLPELETPMKKFHIPVDAKRAKNKAKVGNVKRHEMNPRGEP
jgi:hypothetical protein